MKKTGKCVHYNGTVNDCCDAGVNYKALAGSADAWALRLPCHSEAYRSGSGMTLPRADSVAVCDKRQEPTAEEVAADEAWVNERFEKMGNARAAIVAHLGGPWKRGAPSAGGVIDCPACGGKQTLHFSRAGYNGHIHASCETEDCVRWME
jgi:hypothetical protein